MNYEIVIGLEVHVELSTASKVFCSCPTLYGQAANTQCCPVCTGMPGALPVLNRQVVEYAMRACLAANCKISEVCRFDRKNYFYPDLPKAYQISQLYQPIGRNGYLDIEIDGKQKRIRIHELHMEEDAGKLMHDPWDDCTMIDYNRCGVPLLEIVSEPDLRSAAEAAAYLEKMRSILQFSGVSDCRMQEGSLRADVNVSVRRYGTSVLGTRTEMKNMNSFKAIQRAIEKESARQIEILEAGGIIRQETRRWDENKDASFAMRSKEDAHDYRYFPDPDLTAVRIDGAWLEKVKNEMPELAESKRHRYCSDWQLSTYEAELLTSQPALAYLFESTAAITDNPKLTASWIMGEILQICSDQGLEVDQLGIEPAKLARIITLTDDGTINRTIAKKVLLAVIADGVEPDDYVSRNNLAMISSEELLVRVVCGLLDQNPASVEDYKAGKQKVISFIMGLSMRELKGRADPRILGRIITDELNRR